MVSLQKMYSHSTLQTTQNKCPQRDGFGHGTHTSTIAPGSFVANAIYKGLALGTVRDGAPRARIVVYKVCWNVPAGHCSSVDILKAFDEAIHDGVDVLLLLLASRAPLFSEVDEREKNFSGCIPCSSQGYPCCLCGFKCRTCSSDGGQHSTLCLVSAATTLDRSLPHLLHSGTTSPYWVNQCIEERRLVLLVWFTQRTQDSALH